MGCSHNRDIHILLNSNSNCVLQQGSRLWADYEVTWEKDGFTQYSRNQTQGGGSRMQEMAAGQFKNEALRRQRYSGSIPDDSRRKRFKVSDQLLLLIRLLQSMIVGQICVCVFFFPHTVIYQYSYFHEFVAKFYGSSLFGGW